MNTNNNITENMINKLAKELNISNNQVNSVISLIDDGNTIPFIARYRKEVTGNLSDEILRDFYDRLTYLRNLEERKKEVLTSIENQGKLTDELVEFVNKADTLSEVEDIYRPYKQKKRTRAMIAKEKGLEDLASLLIIQDTSVDILKEAEKYVNLNNNEILTAQDAVITSLDIIAEDIADNSNYRKYIRVNTYLKGLLKTELAKEAEKVEGYKTYEMYFNYSESINKLPSHRILAINRAEKEKVLKVKIEIDSEIFTNYLENKIIKKSSIGTIYEIYLKQCIKDSYTRLIKSSIENEIRSEITEKASDKAIKVFGTNLKSLFMQPCIKDMVIMGFDPAYRTGCKIAIIDETGKLLDYTTVYPTMPQNDVKKATEVLLNLIHKYKVTMISLGNGTASRESEEFIASLIEKCNHKVYYAIVSEAGASVYSASKLASLEYKDINVSIRGAISIARRLADPLAELVKIDPKSIGVGQYQHDVNQKALESSLTGVVEDSVNTIGVDINTATMSLLKYVSGINEKVANNIVAYREANGRFTSKKELLKVEKLGKAAFVQCAGFTKVPESTNVLDNTMVHPESYDIVKKLFNTIGVKDITKEKDLNLVIAKTNEIETLDLENISKELNVGYLTLLDIIKELKKPGRDIRDEMPKIILKSGVTKLEDLYEGLILEGTVRNVTDFGAFVDIGIKNDGLVHISQLSDRFVKNPSDVVTTGDIVKVRVLSIDKEKGKASLSMKNI